MKNNWILISYYTENYEQIAQNYLLKSLKNFSIPYHILKTHDRYTWKKNTDYKPFFISECLQKFKEDLVLIDTDATINNYPILFDNIPYQYDLGIHYLNWELHYGRPSDKNRKEMLSGTIYLRNNSKIRQLVQKWIENTKKYSPEQKALAYAIKKMPNLQIYELPREYCYIYTTPNGHAPAIELEHPIITHYQASRINRK